MPIFNTHAAVFRRVCRYPASLRKTANLIATHLGGSINQEATLRFTPPNIFLASFFIGNEMLDLFIELLTKIRCVAIRLSLFLRIVDGDAPYKLVFFNN